MTENAFHRYRERETEFRIAIKRLEGQVLRDVLLQVIGTEINVVVLVTESGAFSIQGAVGGELLELVEAGPGEIQGGHARYERFAPAARFAGARITPSRVVGETWNGHGLELSIENHLDETLIVQSIYAGAAPDGFDDCLRVAVVKYMYACVHGPSADQPLQ